MNSTATGRRTLENVSVQRTRRSGWCRVAAADCSTSTLFPMRNTGQEWQADRIARAQRNIADGHIIWKLLAQPQHVNIYTDYLHLYLLKPVMLLSSSYFADHLPLPCMQRGSCLVELYCGLHLQRGLHLHNTGRGMWSDKQDFARRPHELSQVGVYVARSDELSWSAGNSSSTYCAHFRVQNLLPGAHQLPERSPGSCRTWQR